MEIKPRSAPFGKAEYLAIKHTLSFVPSTLLTICMLATSVSLFVLGAFLVLREGLASYLVSQVLFAIAFFQGFGMLHECGHGNATSHKWLNVVCGHLASLLCFLPFYPWRYIHQEHHLWNGNLERDPTWGAVRRWRESGRVPTLVRFAWRSWIPLTALIQHVVFWSYPLKLVRDERTRRGQLVRAALSVGFQAVAYTALLLAFPNLFRIANFGLALLLYLLATELVNLPHHIGTPNPADRPPLWEQWRGSRTCFYPRVISEFFVMNFNFHVEHHLFPSLPWFRLRQAHHRVRAAIGDGYQLEVGVSWNLRNRTRSIEPIALVGVREESMPRVHHETAESL